MRQSLPEHGKAQSLSHNRGSCIKGGYAFRRHKPCPDPRRSPSVIEKVQQQLTRDSGQLSLEKRIHETLAPVADVFLPVLPMRLTVGRLWHAARRYSTAAPKSRLRTKTLSLDHVSEPPPQATQY